ncbi:MAG TPA: TIGR03621 family F420-dependent LLM class oxidoreductase [Methylomirabilota bacterium]|jgi:probable F420-dependent oxidoreductase|nr:TIGR03621 family F420-dependent LLM class oxidoreductase [Methylomirabilota bacterium]
MRPFRFGVSVRSSLSGPEWIALARRVEGLGYATLSLPDHLTERPAPFPALTAAATATTRLRVGTLVLNNDFRHPVLLAREAATLDWASAGRFELGLGAGYVKSEYDEAGLAYDRGAIRVERLAESITIVKRLFEGEAVTVHGRHYRVTGHTLFPRPVQRPRPPILVGGNGPRLLALASAEADIVGFSGITFADAGTRPELSGFRAAAVDERIERVRAAAGSRPVAPELNALIQRVVVTDDRRAAATSLAQRWTALSVEQILESPFVLLGSTGEIAEQLVARRARWGFSYFVVFDDVLEAFAPIVARLAGA